MSSLSRLSENCKKCPYVESCQNKRMEALAYYPESLASETAADSSNSMAEPIMRETIKTIINGSVTEVYKDDIEKELYGKLYAHLYDGLMNSTT